MGDRDHYPYIPLTLFLLMFHLAGQKLIKKKDCVVQDKCGKNDTDSFAGIKYVTSYKCCEGDFCNSGATLPSAHISLPMLLAIAGAWLLRFL